MNLVKAALLSATLLTAAPAFADERAKDIETFMNAYLRLWNAHDAAAVVSQIYRFEAPNTMGTVAGLQTQFDQLKAQGYDHSTATSIKGCLISADRGLAEMRFSRLKADGTPVQANLASLYMVRKFPDGWRVTALISMDPTASLNCTSAAPKG